MPRRSAIQESADNTEGSTWPHSVGASEDNSLLSGEQGAPRKSVTQENSGGATGSAQTQGIAASKDSTEDRASSLLSSNHSAPRRQGHTTGPKSSGRDVQQSTTPEKQRRRPVQRRRQCSAPLSKHRLLHTIRQSQKGCVPRQSHEAEQAEEPRQASRQDHMQMQAAHKKTSVTLGSNEQRPSNSEDAKQTSRTSRPRGSDRSQLMHAWKTLGLGQNHTSSNSAPRPTDAQSK